MIGNVNEKQIDIMVREKLKKTLENIDIINNIEFIDPIENNIEIEMTVNIRKHKIIHFICKVIRKAEPLIVKNAVLVLKNHTDSIKEKHANVYGMIAAPYISQASGKICEEASLGYIDLSGNSLIKYKSIYVMTKGNPNIYIERRGERAVFARSATVSSIILRNLLKQPEKQWRVRELAAASSASLGQISNVKRFLEEREYVKIDNKGFYIDKPKEMITDWAEVYNKGKDNIYEYYSLDPIPKIEKKLIDMRNEKDIDSLLTGFAGSVRYNPVVRYSRVHVYIKYQNVQEAVEYLNIKSVKSGANISVIIPYDECVLIDSRNIKNSVVASPVQVSLDLLGLKGRGEEAAIAIMDKEFTK